MFFSFKFKTDSFVRSISYNICMLFSYNSSFRTLINCKRNGNFIMLIWIRVSDLYPYTRAVTEHIPSTNAIGITWRKSRNVSVRVDCHNACYHFVIAFVFLVTSLKQVQSPLLKCTLNLVHKTYRKYFLKKVQNMSYLSKSV